MCDLCKPSYKEVKTKDSSTSNLKSHLKVHHPAAYNDLESKVSAKPASISTPVSDSTAPPTVKKRIFSEQPRIYESMLRMTKYTKDSIPFKTLTSKVTNLLVKQMLPLSLVDSEEFRDLLKQLDPRFECPGRKYFSQTAIPMKSTLVKEQIITDLQNATSISCTTDGWSSITAEPYVSLTVHFITPTWTLRTYCLRTIYLPDSHTADNIAMIIRNILSEFNLQISAVTSFTTDNGANMKAAIRKLEITRIPCFGHILHNAINYSMKDQVAVQQMLKECRTIVSTLNQSFR